jgi:23S rRNA U2552 (ribose-2'-O)-methylase RlmE/FtsJ
MTYYLLPKSNPLFYKYIDCITDENQTIPIISNSLSCYLYEIKEELKKIEKDWDVFKKYTNPYEYIHTIIPSKKKCVSKCKPLSRSYFKMIEIFKIFDLFPLNKTFINNFHLKACKNSIVTLEGIENNDVNNFSNISNFVVDPSEDVTGCVPLQIFKGIKQQKKNNFREQSIENETTNYDFQPINSFHLAEGPGGFIEALVGLRKCSLDKYVGMTILDNENDPNIPAWKKSEYFLKHNKNVFIEKGADNTGNILSLENFRYCKEKYASKMDLVTADGGFDFSIDFNNQEINISRLLFAQLSYALIMQKKGGSFILKIFDSFMQHTIDILFILSSFYEKVYIIKPQTSRYANSEKYIVCKGFLFSKIDHYYSLLYNAFEKMMNSQHYIHRFININIPLGFIVRLEEYNAIFGQQQIENIYYTLSLIKNKNKQEKIDNLIKTNIQKCVLWCIKYNIPYNQINNDSNIFLENEELSTYIS